LHDNYQILKRREFLSTGSTASAAVMLGGLTNISSSPKPVNEMANNGISILATNWGFNGSLEDYLKKVKAEGYDGIETWWPGDGAEALAALLKKYELKVGFLCGSGQSGFKEHLTEFKAMTQAVATSKLFKPLYINCHSGRDYFSFEQNQQFIDHTTALSKQTGVLICHETHRSRIMFAAPVAKQYLQKNPDLQLTFDVSHWCNVHESMLSDQQETVDLVISRTGHIHARIGHPEGPQVNDPRAPEWKSVVDTHLGWWDKIVQLRKSQGKPVTFLTEFGPPDYMPTLAYTQQPLANQWEINVHMLNLLRKRYS
jgi:sugar phosphate isomerase/epimerase